MPSSGLVTSKWSSGNLVFLETVAGNGGEIHFGDGTNDVDFKVFLGSTSEYVLFDTDNSNFQLVQVPYQQTITGEGYSLNLVSVTSTCTSGEGTRGWRVNCTTSDSIASGDLQCVHGYLTLGTSASIANNAAVYPLSAWIDIPDTTTVGTGTVVAGVRAIFDPNNNALGSGTAGCESALFYGQTWASTGTIDCGLFLAAGAGSTIDSAIELGGSGTFGVVLDMTSWGKDTTMILAKGGPKDTTETAHWVFAVGDADSHADIVTALGGTSYGSLFMSTTGAIWVNKAGTWTDCTA